MRIRKRWLALAACAGLLCLPVSSALAIHVYNDVPDTHPFHADIAAIRAAGITGGKTCEPPGTAPTFCPEEEITREAMAAFMHRGFGRITGENSLEVGPAPHVLAEIEVHVGGVPGGTHFVKLDGFVTSCDCVHRLPPLEPCPCVTNFYIAQEGRGGVSPQMQNTAYENGWDAGSVTTVVAVPTATTQRFTLIVNDFEGGRAFGHRGGLSAIVAPFGATG
jgi:hypothetical protein